MAKINVPEEGTSPAQEPEDQQIALSLAEPHVTQHATRETRAASPAPHQHRLSCLKPVLSCLDE
eukprot:5102602-Prymnesium_polylepis.1